MSGYTVERHKYKKCVCVCVCVCACVYVCVCTSYLNLLDCFVMSCDVPEMHWTRRLAFSS